MIAQLFRYKRKIVGWVQVASGILSFIILFPVTFKLSSSEYFSFFILLMAIMPFLYLIAGIGVLMKKRGALVFSLILQILAVIDISVGDDLSWYWDPGLSLSFSIDRGGIYFGLDFLAAWILYLLLKLIQEERAGNAKEIHNKSVEAR